MLLPVITPRIPLPNVAIQAATDINPPEDFGSSIYRACKMSTGFGVLPYKEGSTGGNNLFDSIIPFTVDASTGAVTLGTPDEIGAAFDNIEPVIKRISDTKALYTYRAFGSGTWGLRTHLVTTSGLSIPTISAEDNIAETNREYNYGVFDNHNNVFIMDSSTALAVWLEGSALYYNVIDISGATPVLGTTVSYGPNPAGTTNEMAMQKVSSTQGVAFSEAHDGFVWTLSGGVLTFSAATDVGGSDITAQLSGELIPGTSRVLFTYQTEVISGTYGTTKAQILGIDGSGNLEFGTLKSFTEFGTSSYYPANRPWDNKKALITAHNNTTGKNLALNVRISGLNLGSVGVVTDLGSGVAEASYTFEIISSAQIAGFIDDSNPDDWYTIALDN